MTIFKPTGSKSTRILYAGFYYIISVSTLQIFRSVVFLLIRSQSSNFLRCQLLHIQFNVFTNFKNNFMVFKVAKSYGVFWFKSKSLKDYFTKVPPRFF